MHTAVTVLWIELATLGDTLRELEGDGGVQELEREEETPGASDEGPDPSNSLETLPLFASSFEQQALDKWHRDFPDAAARAVTANWEMDAWQDDR